jgi:hypothetical protein
MSQQKARRTPLEWDRMSRDLIPIDNSRCGGNGVLVKNETKSTAIIQQRVRPLTTISQSIRAHNYEHQHTTHISSPRLERKHRQTLSSTTTNPLAMSAEDDRLTPQYSPEEIQAINQQLADKTPQEILVWAIDNLKGLYQTTAFGL